MRSAFSKAQRHFLFDVTVVDSTGLRARKGSAGGAQGLSAAQCTGDGDGATQWSLATCSCSQLVDEQSFLRMLYWLRTSMPDGE